MQKAQRRNAAREQKFWFRRDITTHVSPPEANKCCKSEGMKNCEPQNCDMWCEMTVNEIINGKVFLLRFNATITKENCNPLLLGQ